MRLAGSVRGRAARTSWSLSVMRASIEAISTAGKGYVTSVLGVRGLGMVEQVSLVLDELRCGDGDGAAGLPGAETPLSPHAKDQARSKVTS